MLQTRSQREVPRVVPPRLSRAAIIAAAVLAGSAFAGLSIGGASLFINRISTPQQAEDPIAIRLTDGELELRVGRCVRGPITRVEIQASRDGLLDASDPVIWALVPRRDAGVYLSTMDPAGETLVPWVGKEARKYPGLVIRIFLGADPVDPERVLGTMVSMRDLDAESAVIEGARRPRAAFDTYRDGRCTEN